MTTYNNVTSIRIFFCFWVILYTLFYTEKRCWPPFSTFYEEKSMNNIKRSGVMTFVTKTEHKSFHRKKSRIDFLMKLCTSIL